MTLKELKIGQTAEILTVGGEGALRQHFLDMGIIPGQEVKLVKYAPMGDPMELLVQDYELTLRKADAEKIEVRPCEKQEAKQPHTHDEHYAYDHEGNEHLATARLRLSNSAPMSTSGLSTRRFRSLSSAIRTVVKQRFSTN